MLTNIPTSLHGMLGFTPPSIHAKLYGKKKKKSSSELTPQQKVVVELYRTGATAAEMMEELGVKRNRAMQICSILVHMGELDADWALTIKKHENSGSTPFFVKHPETTPIFDALVGKVGDAVIARVVFYVTGHKIVNVTVSNHRNRLGIPPMKGRPIAKEKAFDEALAILKSKGILH